MKSYSAPIQLNCIDEEIRSLLVEAHDKSSWKLSMQTEKHMHSLQKLCLSKETLDAAQIRVNL